MPKSVNTADEYEFVDHDETALSPEVMARIYKWLEPTDYLAESGEFRRHLLSQAPGTGLWICQTDEYRKWHGSPEHGSLWIKGIPGAGKSVTAASIIHHLRTTENCPVLFFFFRNIIAANFSPRALIQDWLAQLLAFSPKLQFALVPRLESNSLAEISDGDLVQLFLDGASSVPKLYCVADALDEMSADSRQFLDSLNSLATYRPRTLKLLITSRPEQYLQRALRASSIVHISLQRHLVDADIALYLSHRFDMADIPAAQREAKQQVVDIVAKRSEGLFLYAKLTMDQIEAAMVTDAPLDLSLLEESLPVGLEQIYTNVLAKQREEHGIGIEVQLFVLEAVIYAARPLRLWELASLTQCIFLDAIAPKGWKALISTCCRPLLEVLEDETLQVIHHSFTEFLRGDNRTTDASLPHFPIINSEKAHKHMAITCLRYLESCSLLMEPESCEYPSTQHKHQAINTKYLKARLAYPFLSYAAENWSYHASRYDFHDEELFGAITEFVKTDSVPFQRWLCLQWGKTSQGTEATPTMLHIAAFLGISNFVSKLLQDGLSVSAVDAMGRTPLHCAASNGHAEVASLLIRHGSNPNAGDERGLKPIHLAALKDRASVVTLLLRSGVEPDTIKTKETHGGLPKGREGSTDGECAILYATQGGHTKTILAMIPFCKPRTLEHLLCDSCRFGRTDAVLAILDIPNVSADATYHGATALYFACRSVNAKCVQALIDRGADIHKTSTWAQQRRNGIWETEVATAPLHALIYGWHHDNDSTCREILHMLIKAGADLEQLDGRGNTALLLAVGTLVRGIFGSRHTLHIPAMRALLEAGANANATDSYGGTALILAIRYHRDPEAVRVLLEHGCDPNHKGPGGESPLHYLIPQKNSGHLGGNAEAVAEYLLQYGADPNQRDNAGMTGLCAGMTAGPKVFRMLLSHCQDNSAKTDCWFSLQHESNIESFVSYLEMLLAEGIGIDTKAPDERTLFLCCLMSDEKCLILKSHGASTGVLDSRGNNALHILCQERPLRKQRLEQLVQEGVDPRSTNNNGDTLLHHIALRYDGDEQVAATVRWLVSLGVPVNAVNHNGSTALHVYQDKRLHMNSLSLGGNPVHFLQAIKEEGNVDFQIRDKNGLAVLHLAAMRSAFEVAVLVAGGADINILTEDSQNVLHLSCRARQPDIVGQILGQYESIDKDRKDTFGMTPLHYACISAEPESVAFLLRHGADVHVASSDRNTLLHACAEVRTEQHIWDSSRQTFGWLRGPSPDPLRPVSWQPGGFSTRLGDKMSPPYVPKSSQICRRSFGGVSTIMKMLLDAGCNVSAVNRNNQTVLDVALLRNCTEIAELFAADEALFAQVTQHLEHHESLARHQEQIRQHLRARMLFMQPRSLLDMLVQDKSAYSQVLKYPHLYLDTLSSEDAAKIINEGFTSDPHDISYYAVLEELMKADHLHIAERVPDLVLHYSCYASVEEQAVKVREASPYHNVPAATSLQIACKSEAPNMLTLQLLVERLHVDVNERGAAFNRPNRKTGKEAKAVPGGTALHTLASANSWWHIEGLKYLITNGAAVDARDENGRTPLHTAVCGMEHLSKRVPGVWRLSALRVLLYHGADPDILDDEGLTPLYRASDAPEIMAELLRKGANAMAGVRSPLFRAIQDHDSLALEVLLDHGVSVNYLDENAHQVRPSTEKPRKAYALVAAAQASWKSAECLRVLFQRGADLLLPLNDDETLVHYLFEFSGRPVQDALLQQPCVSRIDFNSRDQQGRTVLMAACNWSPSLSNDDDEIAIWPPLSILDLKVDPTSVDNDGKTALHHLLENCVIPDDAIAQFINREEVAPTLSMKDNAGVSPFYYALRALRPRICSLLLTKGANILEPDPSGLTVLHHIADEWSATYRCPRNGGYSRVYLPKTHFEQCLTLWQRYIAEGGSINVADPAGNTPLFAYLSSRAKELDPEDEVEDEVEDEDDAYLCHLEHYDRLFPANSGVDVFAVNNEGETALHVISKHGSWAGPDGHDKALFEAMIAKGVDPLKEDASGRTALDLASVYGKEELMETLRRKRSASGVTEA